MERNWFFSYFDNPTQSRVFHNQNDDGSVTSSKGTGIDDMLDLSVAKRFTMPFSSSLHVNGRSKQYWFRYKLPGPQCVSTDTEYEDIPFDGDSLTLSNGVILKMKDTFDKKVTMVFAIWYWEQIEHVVYSLCS
jgi:hypothetical protein